VLRRAKDGNARQFASPEDPVTNCRGRKTSQIMMFDNPLCGYFDRNLLYFV
jgi:hypothetical protein